MERPKRQLLPEMFEPGVPESVRDEIPLLYKDGNAWCCLLGTDFQIGVTGCGDTALEAMLDWDKAYQYLRTVDPQLKSIWDSTRGNEKNNYWFGGRDKKLS
jgi:hypothetical protein